MARHTRYTGYSSTPSKAARVAHARSREQFSRYDTSAIRPKKNMKKRVIITILLLLLVALIVFTISFFSRSCGRTQLADGQEAKITIEQGTPSAEVASELYRAGLINSEVEFITFCKSNNIVPKAGKYLFYGGEELSKIAEQTGVGSNYSDGIMVATGDKISNVAKKVEKYSDGRISADDFAKQCSDASKYANDFNFLKEAGTNSIEGFLYPKTYEPSGNYTADSLVRDMLSSFKSEVQEKIIDKATVQGLSSYQITILASIVEKEATDETRSKVASVFLNRLQINMPLQSDATTAYEVGHDPSGEEVHANSAYSTYSNYGLPPTPICSPSVDSFNAVCFPEDTDYFYFYFKNVDGQMKYYFSKTYEEHNAAINCERD